MRRTHFTEDHDLFRDSFHTFVEREMVPHHEEWDAAGIVPRELFATAGAAGFLGMAVPEEYGGGGVDDFRYSQVIGEELQYAGVASAGLGMTLHTDICIPYFLSLATDEQKARWLPGIVVGRADHRHRDDRARHRLRPGVDEHHRGPRRRPLRRQRSEDVHHQRHQRRPRDHRSEDRSQRSATRG